MLEEFDFLSSLDEKKIKKEYRKEKRNGNIDADIIPVLDKLNAIKGLATLYSCQGHLDKPNSYIVIKFSKELSEFVMKAIEELLMEFNDVRVDWNHYINFNKNNNKKIHKTTILRGNMDCMYMKLFYNKLREYID